MIAKQAVLRVGSLLVLVVLWALIAWIADSSVLPSPWQVLMSLGKHTLSGELPYHLAVTLWRVLVSFLLAMCIGTLIGIVMGRYRTLDIALDGALVLGLNIPALVMIILCYIWLGLTDVAAIVAVALNKIPTVVVTVREGARAVDMRLLEVAQAYRLPRLRMLRQVYLPSFIPI